MNPVDAGGREGGREGEGAVRGGGKASVRQQATLWEPGRGGLAPRGRDLMKQECDGCSLSRLSLEMCNDANSTNLEVKMEQQQLSHVSLISSASPRWVRERSALPTELDSWTDGRTKQRGRSDPFTGSDGGGSGVAGNSGVGRTDGWTDGWRKPKISGVCACVRISRRATAVHLF